MYKFFEFSFEWDRAKAWSNYKKHKITFERATTVFNDPKALTIFDEGHSASEDRWVTLGMDSGAVLITVSHAYQQEHGRTAQVRIISARKASKNEINQYREI